jgi:hypothetical protein
MIEEARDDQLEQLAAEYLVAQHRAAEWRCWPGQLSESPILQLITVSAAASVFGSRVAQRAAQGL